MTAAWDLAEAARLAAELLEDDARMTRAPWTTPTGTRLLGAVTATIDGVERQVAAAVGQAPQFDAAADVGSALGTNAAGIARLRNNARSVADQLEAAAAEIDRLQHGPTRDALADWKSAAERPGGRFSAWCALYAQVKEARAEVERCSASLVELVAQRARLTSERDEAQARIADLEQQRAGAGDALVVVTADRDAARAMVATHEARAAKLRAEFETDDPDEISATTKMVIDQRDALQIERDAARRELAELHTSIARGDPAAGFFLGAYQAANRTIAELKVQLAEAGKTVAARTDPS